MRLIAGLVAVACLGLACVLFPETAAAQNDKNSLRFMKSHDHKNADLVRGRSIEVAGQLEVAFVKGQTSVTLKEEALPILVTNPVVKAPGGVIANIVSLRPAPGKIQVITGRVASSMQAEGYTIDCKLKLSAEHDLSPGVYDVKVELPDIIEVGRALKVEFPMSVPSFTFRVTVFENDQALQREIIAREQAAKAREEERKSDSELKRLFKDMWSGIKGMSKGKALGVFVLTAALLAFGIWRIMRRQDEPLQTEERATGCGCLFILVLVAVACVMSLIRVVFIWP
jgi:hypothetical protein